MTDFFLPATGWQYDALARLSAWAAQDPDVVALRAYGSVEASEEIDAFSDLDVSITAPDPETCAEHLIEMTTSWFAPVFASSRHPHERGLTLRLVLVDLRRIDASIRLPQDQSARRPRPAAPSADPFEALTNDFLFDAVLAAVKAGRADLLIASHLTLGLARHLLVGGMLLRDRDLGTRHHRHGGTAHDDWAARLGGVPVITDAAVVTGLIRRYTGLLADLSAAFGCASADAGPLIALLNAVEASRWGGQARRRTQEEQ